MVVNKYTISTNIGTLDYYTNTPSLVEAHTLKKTGVPILLGWGLNSK